MSDFTNAKAAKMLRELLALCERGPRDQPVHECPEIMAKMQEWVRFADHVGVPRITPEEDAKCEGPKR